ncbi:MBL fold metallo-hydrolase [Gemmata sp.]|uniref:MBL fold metallo-hydrolase n=1 Tax=Gemmata sp. TaxID=1914242 RepID=UPI003F71A012
MNGSNSVRAAEGVIRVPLSIVNAYLIGPPGAGDRGWVLVDAGLSFSRGAIVAAAAAAFGPDARPAAIVLTHGHFDHVGSLEALAEMWDAPVFAHPLELPYLTGRADYPPPDPSVGGGAMALLSPLYSRRGVDLGTRVRPLPERGAVPHLPGWRWLHTPGHSPGHVALFRDADRTLVAGDAFVTTKQESFFGAVFKPQAIHGPPAYFTTDWDAARASVRALAELDPEVAATGHGVPMHGGELRSQLNRLARDFDRLAVPAGGRYVGHPARADAGGVTYTPPAVFPPAAVLLALGAGVAVGALTAGSSE